jgi:hypothetical protein
VPRLLNFIGACNPMDEDFDDATKNIDDSNAGVRWTSRD